MWPLILRNLRYRRSAFTAAFLAMAAGAAIVSACAVLAATGTRAAVPPQRLAGAPVVVLGDQSFRPPVEDPDQVWLAEKVRLSASAAVVLRALPGVAEVVEDVSFPAVSGGIAGLGQDWAVARLGPYTLTAGAPPARPGGLVLDAGLAARTGAAVGGRVGVEVNGVTETFTVTGLAARERDRPVARPALFFSTADARRLAGHPGTADALAVLPAAAVPPAQLERQVTAALAGTRTVTLTGYERGLAEFPAGREDASDLASVATVLGAITLMISMPVIAGVIGLVTGRRGHEVSVLRGLGTPAARIRRMMLGEAAVLCAAAVPAGCLAGPPLARWLFDRLEAGGVVPAPLVFDSSPVAVCAAACLCLASGLAAAYLPLRRAAGADHDSRRDERERSPLAAICLAGGGVLSVATALLVRPPHLGIAGLSVVLLALAGALTLPRLTRAITGLLARPMRALSVRTGHLALLNARGGRAGMAALPIMLATCLATANLYLHAGGADDSARPFGEHLPGAAVMESGSGGVAPAALARAAAQPGVTATGIVTSRVYVGGDPWQGEAGRPAHGVTDPAGVAGLPVSAGSLAALHGRSVALGEEHGRRLGVTVGQTLTVWLGDGAAVDVRVVALLSLRWCEDFLLLPADLLAPHTTATVPTRVLIRAGPGVDAHRAGESAGLRPAAGPAGRPLRAWVDYLVTGVLVVFTAIAVASAQGTAAVRRREEFGVQRAGGATRGQVLRMLGVEAVLVAVIGVVLGTAAVTPVVIPYALAVNGLPLPSGPAWVYLAVVGTGLSSALVATLYHAWCTGGREGWLRGRSEARR
ncbi:ABC transporter permease [Nonomuraea muscovyensis]